ncbi:MAG: formate/nitrite transporter family protein [Eubacterium ventriosum]
MDNHFNTPAEVIDLSIKACENKTRLPLGKMILLGIMAGAFIAFGGATSSTAAHAVENVGVARALAGCILILVKHFCNTLFDKYLSVTSFHWC